MDTEVRALGKGFMRRVKRRWETEYPNQKAFSIKALRNNAANFKQEQMVKDYLGMESSDELEHNGKSKWITSEKIRLVELDREERAKGRGFMKRLRER